MEPFVHLIPFQMLFFYALDEQYLSRLDTALLSEQTLIEMFVEGFKNKKFFQDENGNYTDCHEWAPVTLDEDRIAGLLLFKGYKNSFRAL